MANMSTFLANKVLDHIWGKTSYTMPTVFLGLFTTNPTMPAGTGGVEVTGGSYARMALSTLIGAAASGANSNSGAVTFVTATAGWGTVTGVGVFDALTLGNLLNAGPLTVSKVVGSGDTFSVAIAALTDSLT